MAGVGILSMAILQAVKDTFPVRRVFQRQWLKRWFACKALEADARGKTAQIEVAEAKANPDVAERDLIKLATDGNANAFYDLQIEQLCGQFNAAAQIVLDNAVQHRDLLLIAASLATAEDIQRLLNPPEAAKRPININDPNPDKGLIDERQKYIDARTRVTHQVQRAIDSIQISAGFRWKLYLQCASFGLSALIAGLGISLFFSATTGSKFATAIVTGVLGGFLAPVARDLVAALQQLRK